MKNINNKVGVIKKEAKILQDGISYQKQENVLAGK